MSVSKVSDLTSAHVGKLLRIQTENGAYIEGTLASLSAKVTEPFGSITQVHVAFEELVGPVSKTAIYFLTYGNRDAREIDEEEQYSG